MSTSSRTIFDILQTDLSPEAWAEGHPPLIVAEAQWKQMRRKTNFPVTPRKLQGPRKAVRKFTFGGVSAQWPNDKLVETRAPLLMFVLNGVADYCCGDYMIQIPAGHAIFVPAGMPRRDGATALDDIEDNPQRFCDNILFSNHSGSLEIWLNHDRGNHHYNYILNNSEILVLNNRQMIGLLEGIDEEIHAARPNYGKMLHCLLEMFLWSLQRALAEQKFVRPGRLENQEQISSDHFSSILKAQEYIREHLDEQLTLDKMARLVHISRTQFIRRFREETGQTFNHFVNQCRLEHAKVLLRETNATLDYIRRALGFRSPNYFITWFRAQTGIVPGEFRSKK